MKVKKMKLFKLLGLELDKFNIISVVGGGGKTTSINKLAIELSEIGKSVLITTSTGIFIPAKDTYTHLFIENIPLNYTPESGGIDYYAEKVDNEKLKTYNISVVDEIINRNIYDFVLIEADGSKGRPIKAPAEHEPVISKYTTVTLGVIGLDSLGKEINEENVHRPELLSMLTNSQTVDIRAITDLVLHNNGIFKRSIGKKILLLNKADNEHRIQIAMDIRKTLMSLEVTKNKIDIIVGDVKSNIYR
jgi:probable selenium-dependent hydroxylase accessory protein YqeC